MDCTTCYCRMPRCPLFGQVAPRAQFTWHDWHRQAPRWRCRGCRALVSARTGTAYAGIRTEGTTYRRGAIALAEGLSIRATGRLLDVDKEASIMAPATPCCYSATQKHLATRRARSSRP